MLTSKVLSKEEREFFSTYFSNDCDTSCAIWKTQKQLEEIAVTAAKIENAPLAYSIEDVTQLLARQEMLGKILGKLLNYEEQHKKTILELVKKLKG